VLTYQNMNIFVVILSPSVSYFIFSLAFAFNLAIFLLETIHEISMKDLTGSNESIAFVLFILIIDSTVKKFARTTSQLRWY